MKKFLAIAGLCLMCAAPGYASVVACFKSSAFSATGSGLYSATSWFTWGSDTDGIEGIATCGLGVAGQYVGTNNTKVDYTAGGANTACWCRVLSPVISQYVWIASYSSENECWTGCAQKCANGEVFSESSVWYVAD